MSGCTLWLTLISPVLSVFESLFFSDGLLDITGVDLVIFSIWDLCGIFTQICHLPLLWAWLTEICVKIFDLIVIPHRCVFFNCSQHRDMFSFTVENSTLLYYISRGVVICRKNYPAAGLAVGKCAQWELTCAHFRGHFSANLGQTTLKDLGSISEKRVHLRRFKILSSWNGS